MEKMLNSRMAEDKINEAIEKRNALVDEVEAKKEEFENADTDKRDEILDEVEALTEEANKIDEDVKDLEEQKEKLEEQEERMSMTTSLQKRSIEERKYQMETRNENFEVQLRNAIVEKDEKEVRALLTELVKGTAPVSTYMQDRVEAVWERLAILNEVSISNYKGILAVPYEVSTTPAVFHKEGDPAIEEEQLVLGKILLVPTMLKKMLRVSDEVLALSPQGFIDYLFDEVIYQINLLLENSIVSRNAQDGVIGITNASLTESVSANLTFNAINEAIAQLEDIADPVVVMNRKTFYANVMGLTDLQERPIFQIATDNNGKAQHYINGARVLFTNGLKGYDEVASGEAWAIVGDLKAYKLNLPESRFPITLLDRYTEADADMNRIIGRILAAGNVVRPKALAKIVKGE